MHAYTIDYDGDAVCDITGADFDEDGACCDGGVGDGVDRRDWTDAQWEALNVLSEIF